MRIASLLPAGTDIVVALGAAGALVGVSHECDAAGAAGMPRLTRSAVDAAAAPDAIDAEVRRLAAAGAPLFALDDAALAALRPDVIITQAVCDVCAVSEGDVRAVADAMTPAPRVVTLGATTLDGVLDDVRRVAAAIGREQTGDALVASLRERMRRVHETLKAARAPRPRVAVIEWTAPPFAAGHWVPEMVRRAGGVDALAEPGQHSRQLGADDVRAAAPDILVVAPCGMDARRAAAEAAAMLERAEWEWARALPAWALDANALTSRPGPGLVDGVEALAALMHPSLFGGPSNARVRRVA